MGLLLDLIPDFIVGKIKDRLVQHRTFAYLFYGVDSVLWSLVLALEVYRLTDAPQTTTSLETLVIYGPGIFFLGNVLYSSYQLFRNERDRQRERIRAPVSADPDYLLCPYCHFEQWKGYATCQRCDRAIGGTRLIRQP